MSAPPVRLEELILYVSRRMAADRHVGAGRIKLAKLLWRIDFTAYWKLGRPVSEATYTADRLGPVPAQEMMATRDLEAAGRFEWENDWARRRAPIARDEPRMEMFTVEERALIDDVIERHRNENAAQMVEDAHLFPGWVHAWRDGQGRGVEIPYESVFWDRRTEPTAAELRHARRLADEFAHLL
ncbi:type II toxin-antitoxin system antitoxin SocA domain-containing protein [Conexibacter arvalis]|uniref:Antitoxin SocA-like Panacea domain-containing protein n=1 Tax=Conexibacter arvalis TaxID=912552 RepID=A0A840IIN7_9ACTN|nr:type II toxin-antitoxin system antitoxin SocA domain-containing protein [Conexibacter arvalis]MBB4664205.1 hypothetical protein [Conexibacter arvalis]